MPRIVLLALALLLAGCAGRAPQAPRDTDADGIPDAEDADDDQDGVPDARDAAPLRDANATLDLQGLRLLADAGRERFGMRLVVENDTGVVARIPAEGNLDMRAGQGVELEAIRVELPDTTRESRLRVRAHLDDGREADLSPLPDTLALEWTILLPSGAVAGSLAEGPADGAADRRAGELDAVLHYRLTTA